MGLTPICLAGVAYATFGLNGSYPTVKAPVPPGWKAVPGVYASMSVPKSWQLREEQSDDNGDIFYSGPGGGVGLSAVESDKEPSHTSGFASIVEVFVGGPYSVTSVHAVKISHAYRAWAYQLALPGGGSAAAVLAWCRQTETRVWLVSTNESAASREVFKTLALAG